jgi:hypothetical protein
VLSDETEEVGEQCFAHECNRDLCELVMASGEFQ